MTNNNANRFDVLIAGGGLSGATMALALTQLGNKKPLRIGIVEANNVLGQQATPTYDDRVLALAYGSACYLKQLGVWQRVSQQATGIHEIHVSDLGHYGKARLYAKDYNVNALGYVIEMRLLGEALIAMLRQHPQITWFTPDSIENLHYESSQVKVTLASGQVLNAELLLGCDGGNSQVRQLSKIESTSKDYEQYALICNLDTERAHNGKAYERFTDEGPLAMLPMSANRCSLVWTMPEHKAQTIAQLDNAKFCQLLTQRFGHWLGNITKAGHKDIYPLKLIQAQEQVRHRMALVGNASHTLHPIAGQGFNLGLRDIQLLHRLLTKQQGEGDLGEFSLLSRYDRERLADQNKVIGLTDFLVHCFSNNHQPTAFLRGTGLKVLNYCSPLKNSLAEFTMGLASSKPN